MAKKRLIDAYDLAEIIENMKITVAVKPARWNDAKHSVLREISQAPDVDAIEVEKVEEARKEILLRMHELMGEYMKHAMGADYFAGKSESMETAIRLVRAVFADLLDETKKEGTKK